MLRITVCDGAESTTLKLEGRLAGPWVDELEKTWNSIAGSPNAGRLLVDLRDVTFVDPSGRQLLARMHEAGASLAAAGLMTRYIIEKIMRDRNGHTKKEEEKHDCTLRIRTHGKLPQLQAAVRRILL